MSADTAQAETIDDRVSLRLPSSLRTAVNAEADRRGVTFSIAARQALAAWLDPDRPT